MIDDARPRSPRQRAAAASEPDLDDPLFVEEFDGSSRLVPWWVSEGGRIDSSALSERRQSGEHHRNLGLPAGYDTFWGQVDDDPVSVAPTVVAANEAWARRAFALSRWDRPRPGTLLVGAVVAAVGASALVGGSYAHGLAAFATSLVFGVVFAAVVWRFAVPVRPAAVGGAAVAMVCAAVTAVPVVHASRWYSLVVALAFAGGGVVSAALWPIAQAWRVDREHWRRPDVALVAALLRFGDCVESGPTHQDRRRAVAALDRAATRFEFAWGRVYRTGVDVTDRQLRGWAGRIRAETREVQRRFAFDPPSTFVLLMQIYELIRAMVNRYSLADHEEIWVQHGSWRRPPTSALARLWSRGKVSGRYVRQCVLAGFVAAVALFLLADTVWGAVSTFVGSHVSRDLGSALTFDPTVRVFVATISLSLFAVAGSAFSRRH